MVDEESVGSLTTPGCGGKILYGDGALDRYLAEAKLKDSVVRYVEGLNSFSVSTLFIFGHCLLELVTCGLWF